LDNHISQLNQKQKHTLSFSNSNSISIAISLSLSVLYDSETLTCLNRSVNKRLFEDSRIKTQQMRSKFQCLTIRHCCWSISFKLDITNVQNSGQQLPTIFLNSKLMIQRKQNHNHNSKVTKFLNSEKEELTMQKKKKN
jgi:hypothetical protein